VGFAAQDLPHILIVSGKKYGGSGDLVAGFGVLIATLKTGDEIAGATIFRLQPASASVR
jgi:hypothetical protein